MKKLLGSAIGVASVVSLFAFPAQVNAGSDGSQKDVLGIVGSDTTYFVMEALSAAHNINARYNPNKDKAVNIPPLLSANPNVEAGEATVATRSWLANARGAWPGGVVLPADNDCKVNIVFGGYGSRDSNSDGDVNDGTVTGGLAAEAGIAKTEDLNADSDTNDVGETWWLGVVPPNGSGNGADAVSANAIQNGVWYNGTNGPGGTASSACMEIARSSSKQSGTRAARMEGWAFALDAIDWVYFSGNTHGVAQTGLTQDQLNLIYTCYAGTGNNSVLNGGLDANNDGDLDDVGDRKRGYPTYRFWGDVTGNTSDVTPIQPYRIQPGSGTGDDVARTLIRGVSSANGSDSTFLTNCDSAGNDTDGDPSTVFTFPIVQEHDCRGVSDLHKPDAICFYGFSRWVIQARALETDKRNGAVFGKFADNGSLKRPSFSSINETSARFEGTRYVYNYLGLNSGSGTFPRVEDSRRLVGVSTQPAGCSDGVEGGTDDCNFDGDTTDTVAAGTMTIGGQPGFICGDLTARRIISTYGLKPLPLAATDPANGALGQSYCRLATSTNPAF